jgi:hypothetical protein
MIGYRFNPFSRSLGEFPPEELSLLRDVCEGWFIDYKSVLPSAKDLGKHLSAFTNQFGGWLFVGVEEGKGKNLRAEAFPGIADSDVGPTLVQIREAVSAHVSPTVYFEYRVIEGPLDAIGLSAGRSIIVVGVPEGPNPPFVHSSGRIYRRIADSSEPKAETDRAVLDAMWRKSETLRTRLREFVFEPIEGHSKANAFCDVYLMEDLTLSRSEYTLDLREFRDAMTTSNPEGLSIPLENIYTTQDGFIGRHVYRNDPMLELVSLRWWRNGNVRLTIPINYIELRLHRVTEDPLLDSFIEQMGMGRKHYHRLLNLDQWLFPLWGFAVRYLNLRDKLNSKERIWGKIAFSNARLATPFVGMESYVKSVTQHGIPVVQDSIVMYPPGSEASGFAPLQFEPRQDQSSRAFGLISPLMFNGLTSLGVMFDCEFEKDFGLELLRAIERGIGKSGRVTASGSGIPLPKTAT